jgi:hypothetical protein
MEKTEDRKSRETVLLSRIWFSLSRIFENDAKPIFFWKHFRTKVQEELFIFFYSNLIITLNKALLFKLALFANVFLQLKVWKRKGGEGFAAAVDLRKLWREYPPYHYSHQGLTYRQGLSSGGQKYFKQGHNTYVLKHY